MDTRPMTYYPMYNYRVSFYILPSREVKADFFNIIDGVLTFYRQGNPYMAFPRWQWSNVTRIGEL